MEVLFVFDDILRGDCLEGIGDDKAVLLAPFCLVFRVNRAMMAK
jgi:hypothetical protein